MELLPRVNFIFKSASHDLLPNFFNTLDKKRLQIILFNFCVCLVTNQLLLRLFIFFDHVLKLSDQLVVVGFERLNVLDDVVLHVVRCHLRLKNLSNESFKLHVTRWNLLVLTTHG